MPGEATQRIVLCGPYAAAGAHDPHPVTTVEGQAWCPGNPPQHPDGSPVTGDDVREQAVPLAGELRDLAREAVARAEELAHGPGNVSDRWAPLTAQQFELMHAGIPLRITRHDTPQSFGRGSLPAPAFHVSVSRLPVVEVSALEPDGGVRHGSVVTAAAVPFVAEATDNDAVTAGDALKIAEVYGRDAAEIVKDYTTDLDAAYIRLRHRMVELRKARGVTPIMDDRDPWAP